MAKEEKQNISGWQVVGGIAAGTAGLLTGFLLLRYRVCDPNQVLVRTGLGVKDMQWLRKGFHFPFQHMTRVDLNPRKINVTVDGMSEENIEFKVPVDCTIVPIDPVKNLDGFRQYARRCIGLNDEDLTKTLHGIILGETRVLTAKLSLNKLNADRAEFRKNITASLQEDFNQLGLEIVNLNIGDLHDRDEKNTYFQYVLVPH